MPTSHVETILTEAVEIASLDDRRDYLDRACGDDPALRAEVEKLIANYFCAQSFLEHPPLAPILDETLAFPGGAADLAPDTRIGPYTLKELIGEGGMGAVYVAEQDVPVHRKVALKVVKPGMDSREVIARFEAERQALALMDHPCIAKVLDGGTTETGRPYFVMELVRGLSITAYCDRAKLSARDRLTLFVQVCRAVQHAHQKGVIHRDLKPSNLLVTLYDGRPVPKVIDFGVAKAIGTKLTDRSLYTRFTQLIGTPLYMSPEQAEMSALDVDTRSDVYSLGVLLYELLTGTTPFDNESLMQAGFDEMRRIIREVEPPRPSERVSTLAAEKRSTVSVRRGVDGRQLSRVLRGDLDWVVMKALEKDRERRYESAGSFAADVERYLSDEAVQARPPSAVYRLRKFARRNRVGLGVAAVVLVAAGSVTGLVWRQNIELVAANADTSAALGREEKQRELAERREAEARTAAAAAKESDETTKAVVDFVEKHVFGAPNPHAGGLGPNVTLRQALDDAEPRIGTEFADRPRVEAKLRNMLAQTYFYIDEARLALPQCERAYALGKVHFGLDDAFILDVEYTLSFIYNRLGRSGDAVAFLEPVLARRRQTLGSDHHTTLKTIHLLAESYDFQGRRAEGAALWKELHALFNRWSAKNYEGITPLEYWRLQSQLGVWSTGPKFVRFFEAGLPDLIRERGPDDDEVLGYIWWLLRGYAGIGKFQEAAALAESTYPRVVAKYKYRGAMFMNYLSGLPDYLNRTGRTADAVKVLEAAVPEMQRIYGPANTKLVPPIMELASYYTTLGRHQDGIKLLEATLGAIPTAERDSNECYGPLLGKIADGYCQLGDIDQLRRMAVEREAWLRRRTPDAGLTDALHGLGRDFLQLGLYADCERVLREALDRRTAKLGLEATLANTREPRHGAVINNTGDLAMALTRLGRIPDAIALQEQLLASCKVHLGPDHPHTLSCMHNLATFYHDEGEYEKAEPLLRYVVPREQAKERKSRSNAVSLATLGANLLRQQKHTEAEPFLQESLAVTGEISPDDWQRFRTMSELGEVMLGQRRYAEAEPLLLQGYEGMKLREAKIPPYSRKRLAEAAERVVKLYEAIDKPDKAREWRQKLPPEVAPPPRVKKAP